jgi:hypothetical protein
MTAAKPFTIRELLASLPHDPATLFVHISNVASPMSHNDVVELVGSRNISWQYCCESQRTDFIVQVPSLDVARKCVATVNNHVKFQGLVLKAAFVEGFKAIPTDFSALQQFATEPRLFYSLPPDSDYGKKVESAVASIAKLTPIKRESWVEKR